MKKVGTIHSYDVYQLDCALAKKHAKEFAMLADMIPLVSYTERDIVAESKPWRPFWGKWEHSLAVFDGRAPIALVMCYEREGGRRTHIIHTTHSISVSWQLPKRIVARALRVH